MSIQANLVVFDQWKAKVSIFCKPLQSLTVTDKATQVVAEQQLREASILAKGIEEARKKEKEPYLEAGKKIDDYAKQISKELEPSIAHVKGQLSSWAKELEKQRAEELKKAEAARIAKEEELKAEAARNVTPAPVEDAWNLFDAPAAIDPTMEVEAATAAAAQERNMTEVAHEHRKAVKQIEKQKVAGSRKVWKFEIVHAGEIPREFLMIDESAIRQAVMSGERVIPGVKIFEDTIVVAGRR